MNVETAVEDRVDGAVEQCQRLDERIDGVGDDELVLGPDVDEMDDEVRRPAADERSDDAQRHLHDAEKDRRRLDYLNIQNHICMGIHRPRYE